MLLVPTKNVVCSNRRMVVRHGSKSSSRAKMLAQWICRLTRIIRVSFMPQSGKHGVPSGTFKVAVLIVVSGNRQMAAKHGQTFRAIKAYQKGCSAKSGLRLHLLNQ